MVENLIADIAKLAKMPAVRQGVGGITMIKGVVVSSNKANFSRLHPMLVSRRSMELATRRATMGNYLSQILPTRSKPIKPLSQCRLEDSPRARQMHQYGTLNRISP